MDLEGILFSKICQKRKTMYDFSYMWNLKNKNKHNKMETDSEIQRLPEGKGGGESNR